MAGKAELSTWKDRLTLSHRKFKSGAENNIKKWRDYYRGRQWSPTAPGTYDQYRDKVVDNMVFSNIRTIMPSINFRNPRICVQPRKKPYKTKDGVFDTIGVSVAIEMLLNYRYKTLEIKREVDKALLDALLGPWGIVQIGYALKTEKIKDDELQDVNELIKEDSPFIKRISPLDFRVDVEGKDSHLFDARWIGIKWVKSLDEVKAHPDYEGVGKIKANVKVKTETQADVKWTETLDKDNVKDPSDLERVEGWDIWDKKTHKIITIVDSHEKFLQYRDWPIDYGDGFPVETLYFNENPDELFPVSDVDIYLTGQDELNRIRSLQLSHIKNVANRKYIAQENTFDAEEMNKLTHGPDGTVALSKKAAGEAITVVQDAHMSQDIYLVQKGLKDSIRETMGIAQYERGVSQKFDTATEPELIAQGVTIARSERLSILEDFIKHIMGKLLRVEKSTLTDTASIPLSTEEFKAAQEYIPTKLERMVGKENEIKLYPWLNLTKDDLAGGADDYGIDIEMGSTQPLNLEKRKRDAMTLYQATMQNPFVDSYEVTKDLFDAFEKKETEKFVKQKQQVAQEGMQKAQVGIQMEQAKDAPKRAVDLQKTMIKAKTNLLTTAMKLGKEKSGAGV